jgi:sialate O-acetylesterase
MRSPTKRSAFILFFLFVITMPSFSQIKLPRLISDGMVLQRDAQVKLWGWAAQHENVSIAFRDTVYRTSANANGEWFVTFNGLKPGGPYTMTVSASNSITVNDIMVGDVWVCSGQSNMELPVKRVRWIYESEVAHSTNPSIRQFAVPQRYDFNSARTDLESGSWQPANPKNVLEFSAAAYFFAVELYNRYRVPIGLINASLGGSPAEAWLSEDALKEFPVHYQEAQKFKDQSLIKQIESQDKARIDAWYNLLWQKDEGRRDPRKSWFDPKTDVKGWARMNVPGYWATTQLGAVNGAVWFRKEITVPSAMIGKPATLILGRIVDADSVFVNGVFVGTVSYQYPPRRYDIPPGILHKGRNIIVVRVISNSGKGGFVPDKPYELVSNGQTIDLKGEWQYRLGAVMEPLASQTFIRWKPLGLFNGMISPLLNYAIKGVAWYQGESNAGRPTEYRTLLPALIRNWRAQWNQGEIPFLIVQLPNFMESKIEPTESNWALMREAQLQTLAVPHTGLVVAIDIGEWNDIHPLNKKDVGKRLALAAETVAYGDETVTSSGPIYQSMKIDGKKIVLTFTNTGSGLKALGGDLKCFAIAGADKRFVWAEATIDNGTVVVWNENISAPMYVRYAWADNPAGANLYNNEDLPASPFRTDK